MQQQQPQPKNQNFSKDIKSAYKPFNDFLDQKQFKILEVLGKGSFSTVYKVQRIEDNKLYAMKKINLSEQKERDQKNALTEIRLLASFKHENIVAYKQSFFDNAEGCLYVIMEYAKFGDIKQKIELCKKKNTYLSEGFIMRTCLQIAKALNILHENNILHRDVKPANIFIIDFDQVKLGDLNISKITEKGFGQTQAGTPYTSAPEVWQYKPYSSKADIWSLGCVLYEMTTLNPPFTDLTMKGLYNKILNNKIQKIPNRYSKKLQTLIENCLDKDPTNRPTAAEILNNNQLKQFEQQQAEPKNNNYFNIKNFNNLEKKFDLIKTIVFPKNMKSQMDSLLPSQDYEERQLQNENKLISRKIHKKKQISVDLKLISEQKQQNLNTPKPMAILQQQQQNLNLSNNKNSDQFSEQQQQLSTNDNSKNSIVLPPIESVQRVINLQILKNNQYQQKQKNSLLRNAIINKCLSNKYIQLEEDESEDNNKSVNQVHSHRRNILSVGEIANSHCIVPNFKSQVLINNNNKNNSIQEVAKNKGRKFISVDSRKSSFVFQDKVNVTKQNLQIKKLYKLQKAITQNMKQEDDCDADVEDKYQISPLQQQEKKNILSDVQKKEIQKIIELQTLNNSAIIKNIYRAKQKKKSLFQQYNDNDNNNNSINNINNINIINENYNQKAYQMNLNNNYSYAHQQSKNIVNNQDQQQKYSIEKIQQAI